MTLQKQLCNTCDISESHKTELSEYPQVICHAQLPFIYNVEEMLRFFQRFIILVSGLDNRNYSSKIRVFGSFAKSSYFLKNSNTGNMLLSFFFY